MRLTKDEKGFRWLGKEVVCEGVGIQERYRVVMLKEEVGVGFLILDG